MPGIEEIRAYYAKIQPCYGREVAARRDLPFWRGLARRWKPRRILEIGCGMGQVARAMSRGAMAVGTDVSFDLLRRARGTERDPGVAFVAADFRETLFGIPFDLIVAPSDPLCHLTTLLERRRALRTVARQLAPDGRFVLDALLRRGRKPVRIERRLRDRKGDLLVREVWRPAGRPFLWRATYRYREVSAGGSVTETEASFLARAWDPAEIRPSFASCGLAVEEVWGGFSRRPFGRKSSRLIVVARPAN